MSDVQSCRPYSLNVVSDNDFVAEARGFILNDAITLSPQTVQCIKEDVLRYRVLVFKDQGVLSPERQIQISQHFGDIEEAGFEQHEKSPDRKILRVSNDEDEGFRVFGTGGWHVDGTFMRKPNPYSIYHIINCPSRGSTGFLPLYDVYDNISEEMKERWQRLHLVKTFQRIRGYRDRPGYVIHPLIYPHPGTGKWTFCIHQGKTRRFIWDRGTPHERKTSREEAVSLLGEIDQQLNVTNKHIQYMHQWEPGDFIITDNLAVAHWATPDTQLPVSEVGLRVMHRTVIKGVYRPRKPWDRPPGAASPWDTPPGAAGDTSLWAAAGSQEESEEGSGEEADAAYGAIPETATGLTGERRPDSPCSDERSVRDNRQKPAPENNPTSEDTAGNRMCSVQ